jgi:hypothetical protein
LAPTTAAPFHTTPTCLADRREQEVVVQELQHGGLGVLAQAVHLQAALVIDVGVSFLGRCKEELVVQEGDVARRLLDLAVVSVVVAAV